MIGMGKQISDADELQFLVRKGNGPFEIQKNGDPDKVIKSRA